MNDKPSRKIDWNIILGIAVILFALYTIAVMLFELKSPMSKIFFRYKYHIRGLFDVFSVIAILPLIAFVKERTISFVNNRTLNTVIIIISLIGTLNMPLAFFDIGSTQIGSFIEQRQYKEEYYVETMGQIHPATVLRVTTDDGYCYVLEKISFFGDTDLHFTYEESIWYTTTVDQLDVIVPNIPTKVTAENGYVYTVKLTTNKVRSLFGYIFEK